MIRKTEEAGGGCWQGKKEKARPSLTTDKPRPTLAALLTSRLQRNRRQACFAGREATVRKLVRYAICYIYRPGVSMMPLLKPASRLDVATNNKARPTHSMMWVGGRGSPAV